MENKEASRPIRLHPFPSPRLSFLFVFQGKRRALQPFLRLAILLSTYSQKIKKRCPRLLLQSCRTNFPECPLDLERRGLLFSRGPLLGSTVRRTSELTAGTI